MNYLCESVLTTKTQLEFKLVNGGLYMNDTKKVNQSSIRYSNQVKEIIDNFEGNSFGEKLENIVIYCFANIDTIRVEEQRLKKNVNDLKKEILQLRNFKSQLDNINNLSRKLVEQITMSIDEDSLND